MTASPRTRLFTIRPHRTNIGNDVITLATDLLLHAAWPEPLDLVSLPAVGVPGSVKGSGLDAHNTYAINQLADGVLIGGGNLFENGDLNVVPGALAALDVPLGLLALSAGRVHGRGGALVRRTDALSPAIVKELCARADPVLVRDDATALQLGELGVDDVIVAGCPSLFLDRLAVSSAPDPLLAGTALVSIRDPGLMSLPFAEQGLVRDHVRRIVADLTADYDAVALLCHDYRDLAFAATMPGVSALYTEDPRQFISWIRGCALNVTYRLHAFLTCLSYDVPSINISYDERAETMVEMLGVEAWNVRMPEVRDIPGAVRDRCALGAGSAHDVAQPVLDRVHAAMVEGIGHFAGHVADATVRHDRELRRAPL